MAYTLYTAAIGLSAFLLFLVQPLIAKLLLPGFGGGASIWITSLVFFQVVLLTGYGLTHLLIQTVGIRRHMFVLGALLIGSLAVLPLSATIIDGLHDRPTLRLLMLLTASVGLPYLVLSTTSPTLQYWMARDARMPTANPYIQYGVSNGGSLAGLLAYPFIAEPLLYNTVQSWTWSALYVLYAVAIGVAMFTFIRANRDASGADASVDRQLGELRGRWFLQALVPSALLLVTTHYLTLDVVNFPLLWIAPLAIYLLTFVICFLFPATSRPTLGRTVLGVLAILILIGTSRPEAELGLAMRVGAALLCLFVICMIFHGDLERGKPAKQALTGFYLVVASGGAAGSVLVGLIAPLLFDSSFEFPLVILAALVYVVVTATGVSSATRRALPVVAAVVAGLAYLTSETTLDGQTIARERSFYGTYAVRDADGVRRLVAGTHVHGEQFLDAAREHVPIAYYHDATGAADLFRLMSPERVAFVGLGIGSLIEFGDATTQFDIYELDPLVIRLAREHFTVLDASPSRIEYFVGDARVQLRRSSAAYDLIVMDAFTSGSIPTHLVTAEAIGELLGRLQPAGAIAYHISNHYLDLLPVLTAVASVHRLELRLHESISREAMHMYPARWVLLTRDPDLVGRVDASEGWSRAGPERTLWLDESSNIWSVLK